MANKKFLVGMLVMVLVFGMMVVGCDDNGLSVNEWRFRNESSHTIVVEGGCFPDNFELSPGAQRTVRPGFYTGHVSFNFFRRDTGDRTGVATFIYNYSRTTTFRDSSW